MTSYNFWELCNTFNIMSIKSDLADTVTDLNDYIYVCVCIEKDTAKSDAVIGASLEPDTAKRLCSQAYKEEIYPKWGGNIPLKAIKESSVLYTFMMKYFTFIKIAPDIEIKAS